MTFELRLNDKEPATQRSGGESSKQREQKPETEPGTSPVQTKYRKKASAEEEGVRESERRAGTSRVSLLLLCPPRPPSHPKKINSTGHVI